MIRHKKRIEFSALKLLREVDNVFEIKVGVGIGARVAPRTGMNCHGPHKGAEMEFSILAHCALFTPE